jgi:hypothetical protein
MGGRKKGTPNRISAAHKKAMREAMHRIGSDGNGKDGEVGYFKWVAWRDVDFFYLDVWSRLLELEEYQTAMGVASAPETMDEAPPRHVLRKKKTRPLGWLRGDDDPYESLVQDYMRMAVKRFKIFCKMFVGAFLVPPKNWRARVARRQRYLGEVRSPAIVSPEEERNQELKFAQFCALFNGGKVVIPDKVAASRTDRGPGAATKSGTRREPTAATSDGNFSRRAWRRQQ